MNTTVVRSNRSNPYLAAAGGSSDRPGAEREPSSPGAALLRGEPSVAASAYGAGVESQAMKRQRGDDSLLFSCENLQPKAPSEKPQAGGTGRGGAREDNSGLIDIQALARRATGATAAPQNSILPMFTPAVMAPVLVPVRRNGPPAWLRIFIVGSVLALAGALAVLAVYLYRSPRARTSAPAPIAAPVAPSAVPAAPATAAALVAPAPAPRVVGPAAPAAQPSLAAAPAGPKAVTPATSRSQASTRRHSAPAPVAAAVAPAPAPKPAEPVAPAPPSQRAKPPKTAGGSDVDLDGLINAAVGSDSGRSARGGTANTTETLPEHLTRNDILTGVRSVQSRVAICYGQYHVPGTAMVNLNIAPTGKVESANVVGALAGTPSGDCVTKAARAATFARFSGPAMSVQYPFVLR